MMGYKNELCGWMMMGWQFHLDDYFNIVEVCSSVDSIPVYRGFYNCLIIVTLMKYNKQAQFLFPFHKDLI